MSVDGALLLDKPLGLSSNAALQSAKRLLGAAKAGHAGTLDPLASGLLVLLFGEATKFAGQCEHRIIFDPTGDALPERMVIKIPNAGKYFCEVFRNLKA